MVPGESVDTVNHIDHVEYHIDCSSVSHIELPDLVEMGGRRLWYFEWLKAGQPGGLLVRRMMDFQSISENVLVLRSAQAPYRFLVVAGGRSVQSVPKLGLCNNLQRIRLRDHANGIHSRSYFALTVMFRLPVDRHAADQFVIPANADLPLYR